MTDFNGALLLSKSMKQGDSAAFGYAGQTLHITLLKLRNELIGDDFATVRISATKALSESEKIEMLIKHIESLEGAAFIRNGGDHDAKSTADHLRRKLANAGDRVKTANDFIAGIATSSSSSGDDYKIRLKDGTEVKCGEYLQKQLQQIEQGLKQERQRK